jgi:hypothetical protein
MLPQQQQATITLQLTMLVPRLHQLTQLLLIMPIMLQLLSIK